ncbi:aminotransferase class V-fold PLP-dependent enzyme [Bacillota bacterium LX-D]|nr:aminotransferase class V-fold PLP-dependent enzyme [Bacillota bacterium LX-D]
MTKTRQEKTPLFDAIKKYHQENVLPFDVPGHKHGAGLHDFASYVGKTVLEIDVNAMECLDNICNPIGVIKEAEDLAAEAFGGKQAFFLVNGTTCGVQAMIMSACQPGDKIIIPRNAHKSATAGLILSGAIPIYLRPEVNNQLGIAMNVTFENVKKTIDQNPDAKAIFLIHPTYYGVVSDLKTIVDYAHQKGILVLVDQAHGAHFRFFQEFPINAVDAGADITVVSMHKTGGSLTQSSLLILNTNKISPDWMKSILNLTQTTSASYLLMVSLDIARKQLAIEGESRFKKILEITRNARERINQLNSYYSFGKELIGTPGVFNFDETKLGIHVTYLGLTGYEVEKILRREFSIQVELADFNNILAIVSLGDSENSLQLLLQALADIERKYSLPKKLPTMQEVPKTPDIIISPREAYYCQKKKVSLEKTVGEISGESVMVYPPGIPIVAPGEKITKDIVDYIKLLKNNHCLLQGPEDTFVDNIKILKQSIN